MNRELPPRARRIRQVRFRNIPNDGTTSACAENTRGFVGRSWRGWNYLRVRGEYNIPSGFKVTLRELPPRARRIRSRIPAWYSCRGTTSACAENTANHTVLDRSPRNYLRVRGEYNRPVNSVRLSVELPPRARRIPSSSNTGKKYSGTTSACAENTTVVLMLNLMARNYLRVRGEYSSSISRTRKSKELPPRARRIHL